MNKTTFEHKYNIGDEVWVSIRGEFISVTIIGVGLNKDCDGAPNIRYEIDIDETKGGVADELRLFKTKEDLINSMV